jgi:hypothetical protein
LTSITFAVIFAVKRSLREYVPSPLYFAVDEGLEAWELLQRGVHLDVLVRFEAFLARLGAVLVDQDRDLLVQMEDPWAGRVDVHHARGAKVLVGRAEGGVLGGEAHRRGRLGLLRAEQALPEGAGSEQE